MAIQFHTYLSPRDDVGEEIINKAVWRMTDPRITRLGDGWVAMPIGNIFKIREKSRKPEKPPEEKRVAILDRFAPSDAEATATLYVPLVMGKSVKDFTRQIEEYALELILLDPAQAGSVIVND